MKWTNITLGTCNSTMMKWVIFICFFYTSGKFFIATAFFFFYFVIIVLFQLAHLWRQKKTHTHDSEMMWVHHMEQRGNRKLNINELLFSIKTVETALTSHHHHHTHTHFKCNNTIITWKRQDQVLAASLDFYCLSILITHSHLQCESFIFFYIDSLFFLHSIPIIISPKSMNWYVLFVIVAAAAVLQINFLVYSWMKNSSRIEQYFTSWKV